MNERHIVVRFQDLSSFIKIRDFFLSKVETTLARTTKYKNRTVKILTSQFTHSHVEIKGIN